MSTIVDNGSILQGVIAQLRYSIWQSFDLVNKSDLIGGTIEAQWGSSALTFNSETNLIGVPLLLSVASLNDEVAYPPEFGAYVLDPSRGNGDTSDTLNKTAS